MSDKSIKKTIITEIDNPNPLTEQTFLYDILDCVKELIGEYGEDTEIVFDSGYNNINERIKIKRLETDEEYINRINCTNLKNNKILEKEKKEYERLKKKFENNIDK